MKIPFLTGPLLAYLAFAISADAHDTVRWFANLKSINLEPESQTASVQWMMTSSEYGQEQREFKTSIQCGKSTVIKTEEIPLETENGFYVPVKDKNGPDIIVKRKLIIKNAHGVSLAGEGLQFLCENQILKTDFKVLNSPPDDADSLKLWNALYPPFSQGRFNFSGNLMMLWNDARGSRVCKFRILTSVITENDKIKQISAKAAYTKNCISGFYYSDKLKTMTPFLETPLNVGSAGSSPVTIGDMRGVSPDDMLFFYWTRDRTVPTGWMKTVIDTRKDQIWTIPADMPAGATFKH